MKSFVSVSVTFLHNCHICSVVCSPSRTEEECWVIRRTLHVKSEIHCKACLLFLCIYVESPSFSPVKRELHHCSVLILAQDNWETAPGHLRCEFCGKMDIPRKFKRSKRFCSMACAKRYNVGCTKRLGLFSPKEEKPERIKHKMKVQGPKAKPLKGARGKFGRLKFNVAEPWVSSRFFIFQCKF